METGHNPFRPEGHSRARVARGRITGRAKLASKRVTDVRHPESVRAWGAAQEGPFPTRASVSRAVNAEFEVLIRGLGWLAALEPREVFPEPERTRGGEDGPFFLGR